MYIRRNSISLKFFLERLIVVKSKCKSAASSVLTIGSSDSFHLAQIERFEIMR